MSQDKPIADSGERFSTLSGLAHATVVDLESELQTLPPTMRLAFPFAFVAAQELATMRALSDLAEEQQEDVEVVRANARRLTGWEMLDANGVGDQCFAVLPDPDPTAALDALDPTPDDATLTAWLNRFEHDDEPED